MATLGDFRQTKAILGDLKAHVRPRRIARRGLVFIYENLVILRVRVIQTTSIFGFLVELLSRFFMKVVPLFNYLF